MDSVATPSTPIPFRGRRRPVVPSQVIGTLVAIVVETMLFTGFISAFLIAKNTIPAVLWPPPDQPRFPVERTALNTVALLLSGVACWLALRAFRRGSLFAARRWNALALALGAAFVGLQGVEWARLIIGGLTITSSLAGAYFYLLVGAHALHAIAGLVVLLWAAARLASGEMLDEQLASVRIYWTFVVALWPLLYWLVYLK
jgi:heme/copper-type cytochrome/quinol oxidase subunit 3